MLIFKEVSIYDKKMIKCFEKNKIIIGKSLPNSYLFLDKKLGQWTDSFRKKYRQRIKRQIKMSDKKEGYRWEVIRDFGPYSDIFEKLYLQVLERSEYKFEKLNKNFFENVNRFLSSTSCALVCFFHEKIVCFELILEQNETCIPIYLGIDYKYLKDGDLYFSCINKLILYAEENGFKKIKFGQTSYLAKAYVGSVFEDLVIGVYAKNYLFQKILKSFGHLFFTSPEIPYIKVYREEKWEIMKDIVKNNLTIQDKGENIG